MGLMDTAIKMMMSQCEERPSTPKHIQTESSQFEQRPLGEEQYF